MTLAKAVVTGIIYRKPEKRFTTNDVAVSSFVLDVGEKDEMLLRVVSRRIANDGVISELEKGEKVLVEGRLQVVNAKMEDGSERKIYEIDANSVEKMSASANTKPNEEIVKFAQEEFSDELISEDEIPF